jgi:hypothetical protein
VSSRAQQALRLRTDLSDWSGAYALSLERDGGSWFPIIPRIERSTRVTSWEEAEPAAREIIAGKLGSAVDSFNVAIVELRADRASLQRRIGRAQGTPPVVRRRTVIAERGRVTAPDQTNG